MTSVLWHIARVDEDIENFGVQISNKVLLQREVLRYVNLGGHMATHFCCLCYSNTGSQAY